MNSILSVAIWKVRALVSRHNHFTSNVINSTIDHTASICKNVRAYHTCIGRFTYVARNTLIQNTVIGAFCSISEGCNIGMPSHPAYFVSTSPVFLRGGNYLKKNFSSIQYEDCPATYIGNDVWIGAHVQIKSGIRIGNGAIVGAGAVVTENVPPYAIVGGVPAHVIKFRFDESTCEALNNSKWWDLSETELSQGGKYIEDPNEFLDWIKSLKKEEIKS